MFALVKFSEFVASMPESTVASPSGYIATEPFSIVEVTKYVARPGLKLVSILVCHCLHHEGAIPSGVQLRGVFKLTSHQVSDTNSTFVKCVVTPRCLILKTKK